VLLNCSAGSSIARHKHLGAGEYFVVSGRMDYRIGSAKTGDYGYEPLGLIHDHTYFPEDTLLFFANHGAVVFIDEKDEVTGILNHEVMQALSQQSD